LSKRGQDGIVVSETVLLPLFPDTGAGYAEQTCRSSILQAAFMVRSRYPETRVFDYYRDIRTYGRGQEEIYEAAARHNVLFFRYEPDAPPVVIKTDGDWPLSVQVIDTLTFGEELETGVDMVVLGMGIEAGPIPELIEMMKLPVGADGFLQEVHPKLQPVELANTGILLAGTCQAPMDVGETCNAAQAAAVKTASLLIKGYAELDPYVVRDLCEDATRVLLFISGLRKYGQVVEGDKVDNYFTYKLVETGGETA